MPDQGRAGESARDWSWFAFDSVFGVWLTFVGPRWLVALVVLALSFRVLAGDRLRYWTEQARRNPPKPPDGMIGITLYDGRHYYVPPTPELVEATLDLIDIIEGDTDA